MQVDIPIIDLTPNGRLSFRVKPARAVPSAIHRQAELAFAGAPTFPARPESWAWPEQEKLRAWPRRPRRYYETFTLAPRNDHEIQALRAWISSHQSMFYVLGAASGALDLSNDYADQGDFEKSAQALAIAAGLRLASAVYTFLPTIDRVVYETYLRPTMMCVNKSFSAVSSREAQEFSKLIKQLRATPPDAVAAGMGARKYLAARNAALGSDEGWWRLHGAAMRRMVNIPVSLAHGEFKAQAAEPARGSYADFLAMTLQEPDAMADYDRFFACERVAMPPGPYLDGLIASLAISDDFVAQEEPLISYRAAVEELIADLAVLGSGFPS